MKKLSVCLALITIVACSRDFQTVENNTQETGVVQATFTDKNTPWNECNSRSDTLFPDVYYHNGSLWCALQNTRGEMRILEMDPNTFAYRSQRTIPLSPGSLIFNRLGSFNNQLWVAYRDGNDAKLMNVTTGAIETLGPAAGNDPVAIGYGWVAWQGYAFNIYRRALAGGAVTVVGPGEPTGLSQIKSDGTVTLIDNDRFLIAGYTRPCWAGDIVVVEGNNYGLMVRRNDGAEITLWPGQITYTPKCAVVPGGWAVTTWGDHWSRTAILTPADFGPIRAPTPPPTPPPCITPSPGAGWVCVNGGWLPPGHPGIPQNPQPAPTQAPTPTPTPVPTPTPATPPPAQPAPSTCVTVKPGPDWVCVNGGWLPPGHPGIPQNPAPAPQPTPTPAPAPAPAPSACLTVKPGPDWVCVNGGWLPPGHPGTIGY